MLLDYNLFKKYLVHANDLTILSSYHAPYSLYKKYIDKNVFQKKGKSKKYLYF